MAEVTVEETSFATWDDCLQISNGEVELVATTGVGPRVISCGFADGENLFFTDEDQDPIPDAAPYTIHGGHRLWHAPEDEQRTYVPDNDPIEWAEIDGGVRLVRHESETGIRKELSVRLAADEPRVEVTHELENEGLWPVELAPWGITVMRPGGTAVVPFSAAEDGLQADRSLAFWPYTSPADDRLTLADGTVLVEQDPDGDGRLKVGATGRDEWAAYVREGTGFVKTFAYDEDATYPDRGSAVEIYTDDGVLELETLGPLAEVAPGDSAVHTETWHLRDGIDEATVDAVSAAFR
jgi:hypothetical protein